MSDHAIETICMTVFLIVVICAPLIAEIWRKH